MQPSREDWSRRRSVVDVAIVLIAFVFSVLVGMIVSGLLRDTIRPFFANGLGNLSFMLTLSLILAPRFRWLRRRDSAGTRRAHPEPPAQKSVSSRHSVVGLTKEAAKPDSRDTAKNGNLR
mgnify:CR=1 FL=1